MLSGTEVTLGRKSVVGSVPALVGGPGISQLLCSISSRTRLVMGDILAYRRSNELDRDALAPGGMS